MRIGDSIHGNEPSRRLQFTLAAVFFWSSAIFMLFWAFGVRELLTSEGRWAEITRNMVQSGDYFHPRINGEPYFYKPLVGYWTIALASIATSRVNEWAVRLPSAVAGLATLWMTVFLGRRLWSVEAGRIAAWLLLACYGFLFWARTGQADMGNVAFSMMAIAWYWARRDRPGFWTSFIFYLICFVGAQMKGLGAIAVPCLAVLPDLLRNRRWKHLLTLSHAAALALSVPAYFTPFIIASMAQGADGSGGLDLVFQQNVQRFFDPFDHKDPFYIYFYELPILCLPWAPLLVIALVAALARGRDLLRVGYPTRWAMEASLLILLFFIASGSRRSYYILPLVPFCALLCARFLVSRSFAMPRRAAIDLHKNLVLALAAGGLIVSAASPLWKHRLPIPLSPGFFAGLAAFSILALVPWALRKWNATLLERLAGFKVEVAVPLVGMAALMCGYICFQHVNLDSFRTTRTFVRSVPDLVDVPQNLAFYRVRPTMIATVVYYLDYPDPLLVLESPQEVVTYLNEVPGANRLLITRSAFESLAADLPPGFTTEEVASEETQPWASASHRSKKWILIRSKADADGKVVEVVSGPDDDAQRGGQRRRGPARAVHHRHAAAL